MVAEAQIYAIACTIGGTCARESWYKNEPFTQLYTLGCRPNPQFCLFTFNFLLSKLTNQSV